MISLDGTLKADISWKKEIELSKEAVRAGKPLFYKIDLGLFSKLPLPLEDHTQFQSLNLSLHHFRDGLWPEFKEHIKGLCLYEGDADFSKNFSWSETQRQNYSVWAERHEIEDKKLFCRDVGSEYLQLLISKMPDALPLHLNLTISSEDPFEVARLTAADCFERFQFPKNLAKWAICLPPRERLAPKFNTGLPEAFQELKEKNIPFRVIPESHLITDWDGLDLLIYSPDGLTSQGKRKIQGFLAAGGTAITSQEIKEMVKVHL